MKDSPDPGTTRRHALLGIVGGLVALPSCTSRPGNKEISDPSGEALLHDLKQLGARTYSEEGIAVLLIGENLVRTADALPRPASARSNSALADSFHHYVEVLPRVRNDLTEADVPRLIEVLAERDFGVLRPEARR